MYIFCSANYGGSSTLPSVLSSKCDGSTCSVVTSDVDVVKSCLNDPLSAGCKGQQSSHSIIYLILPELKCPGKPISHKLPGWSLLTWMSRLTQYLWANWLIPPKMGVKVNKVAISYLADPSSAGSQGKHISHELPGWPLFSWISRLTQYSRVTWLFLPQLNVMANTLVMR